MDDVTIGEQTPEGAYRQAVAVDRRDADAVLVSYTDLVRSSCTRSKKRNRVVGR